jgi:hypothetical protein
VECIIDLFEKGYYGIQIGYDVVEADFGHRQLSWHVELEGAS